MAFGRGGYEVYEGVLAEDALLEGKGTGHTGSQVAQRFGCHAHIRIIQAHTAGPAGAAHIDIHPLRRVGSLRMAWGVECGERVHRGPLSGRLERLWRVGWLRRLRRTVQLRLRARYRGEGREVVVCTGGNVALGLDWR